MNMIIDTWLSYSLDTFENHQNTKHKFMQIGILFLVTKAYPIIRFIVKINARNRRSFSASTSSGKNPFFVSSNFSS